MNKRPKRTIFKKNLELNEGLHWQEERDLCRALYASLQPSRERSAFDHQENGDSEMTDSGEVNSSSCPEEDSTESSYCPPSSITDSGDMGSESTCSTDQDKMEVPPFNHVPTIVTQRMKGCKERMKGCKERMRKKHKPKKEHKKRSPSLKLEFFEKQDELKNKKIHAQRKFAVSYSPSVSPSKPSPLSTPVFKSKLGISENESDSILNFSPKTEDFLTFLCLRGTSALPGRLDLLKKSHQKGQKKREDALKEHDITKSDSAPNKDSILRRKKRERSLVQKAKAVRTLNNIKKQSRQRPWRECKQLMEISNQINKRDSAISEPISGHLTPPCLSPIPPPIVTVTQHHNPPPLIPIMPLDGSKKGKMQEKVERKKNLVPLTKLRKRQRDASRPTSHQSANSTNAAVEGHQVLLKRKLRSSADEETNELEKTLIAKGGRVKVELLKNEVKDILQRRNNNVVPPVGSKITKKWKSKILNGGVVTHGRVTRANVSKGGAVDGLVLNGKRRGRKKKKTVNKVKNNIKKETQTKKESSTMVVVKEEKKKEDKNEVAPRRSTRKRILRFDVHCVYTGLLSSNNAIIQSANCICPCCKTEDRRPRKRSKVQEKKQHFLRNQDKRRESNRSGEDKIVNTKPERSGGDPSKTGSWRVTPLVKQVKEEMRQEGNQEKKNHIIQKDDISNGGCDLTAVTRTNVSNLTGVNNNLNGSFEAMEAPSSPSKCVASQEKRTPLKSTRNHAKSLKVKTDGIYKNGEVLVKKLRNGTNLSLEEFNLSTGKHSLKEEVGTGSLDQLTGNCTPQSERKRGPKNVIVKRKSSQQPLRRKLEKQFSCATAKPVLNLSSKSKCRIPVTLPALASNCLIKDIQHPSPPPSNHSTTSSSTNLLAVPTFHPNHQEWSNLLTYLESKAKTIETYGMCKVKPPEGREPSGVFPDSLRITPEIQYVHRLQHRWSSSSKRLACLKRHLERKEKVAFQPPQICGCEVDLLKFAELISLEGGFKAVRTKKKWPKLADQLNIPRTVSGRTNKLESICLKYLVSFSNLSQAEKDELMREVEVERHHRLDEAGRTNPFGVTESDVRRGGHQISLCQFKQRADLLEQIIRAGEDNTPCDVENEFWKIVEESDSYIAVQKAEIQGCSNERYSSNLSTLSENCGNILSVLPAATKQKLPTLKVGTVYSVEPWRASSHGLGRFEFLHSGNHKIWYSIPKCQSDLLERVLQQHAAEFETKGQSCLYDKSFILMLPPQMLQKYGLTVYQAVQKPRELIVQWYGAATSSVSCGFHIAESFPLASSDWLEGAIQAFEVSKSLSLPSLFSLEQLLYLLIEDIWSGHKSRVGLLDKLLPVFKSFRNREVQQRNKLQSCGLKLMALADKTPSSPARGSRSPGRSGPRPQDEELSQCITCNHHCYFSMVMNEREDKVYCLDHATEIFNNGKGYPGWTVYYRIGQEKMTEVVKVLSHALQSTQSDHREDIFHNFVPTLGEAVVA